MLMEMGRLTILNSYRLQCIGTDLSGMNIFTKHSSILIRTIVGEYCKIYIVTHISKKKKKIQIILCLNDYIMTFSLESHIFLDFHCLFTCHYCSWVRQWMLMINSLWEFHFHVIFNLQVNVGHYHHIRLNLTGHFGSMALSMSCTLILAHSGLIYFFLTPSLWGVYDINNISVLN